MNNDFDLIPNTFEDAKDFGCNEFSSFSIFYLLKIKQYITISQCKCDNDFMIRLFLIMDNCDEFNKTQLYIMNENSLDTSNFNQINNPEYLLETNEISKNSDNYEQSKSEKLQNTSIISYLTDLEHTESKANTLFLSTDYFTNKDLQIESDDNTENIEIPKGSNYTDKQILESNTQSLEKSTYYNTDIFKEFSSYSSNLIKDIPTINFKSEIIDQESSNVNKELTDHNKEQLTNYNSEIAEKGI